jgi:hypothetical protein
MNKHWIAYEASGNEYPIEVTHDESHGWRASSVQYDLVHCCGQSEAHAAHLACGYLLERGIVITDLCPEGVATRRALKVRIAELEREIDELQGLLEEKEGVAP